MFSPLHSIYPLQTKARVSTACFCVAGYRFPRKLYLTGISSSSVYSRERLWIGTKFYILELLIVRTVLIFEIPSRALFYFLSVKCMTAFLLVPILTIILPYSQLSMCSISGQTTCFSNYFSVFLSRFVLGLYKNNSNIHVTDWMQCSLDIFLPM